MNKIYIPTNDRVYGADIEELAKNTIDIDELIIQGGELKRKKDVSEEEQTIQMSDQPVFCRKRRAAKTFSKEKNRVNYTIYVSENAWLEVLTEIKRYRYVETGGVLIGVRKGNMFFFDKCIDSGIHSKHSRVFCKRDVEYLKHVSNTEISKYDIDQKEITVHPWHRHPDHFSRFSGGDFASNTEFARYYDGVISSLALIDPNFRFLSWYIEPDGRQKKISNKIIIDSARVREAMPLKDAGTLIREIENNEHPEQCRIPTVDDDLLRNIMISMEKSGFRERNKNDIIEEIKRISFKNPNIDFVVRSINESEFIVILRGTSLGEVPVKFDLKQGMMVLDGGKRLKGCEPKVFEQILTNLNGLQVQGI